MNIRSFIEQYAQYEVPGKFSRDFSLSNLLESFDGHIDPNLIDIYLCKAMLKKHPGDVCTKEVTLEDFRQAELRAYQYNLSFDKLLTHPSLKKALDIWRDQVHLIMGHFSMTKVSQHLEWPDIFAGKHYITSGSTSTCATGNDVISRFKRSEVTYNGLEYIKKYELFDYLIHDEYVVGLPVLNIVPKTAKVGRVVFSPTAVDGLFQRAIGVALRRRLSVEGIDLDNAQDIHRAMVMHGSRNSIDIVTDDMKWASALIYRRLVEYLTPSDWFECLDAFSDRKALDLENNQIDLSQFAVMGNGFCFELETIIFLGLLRTAAFIKEIPIRHRHIRVFGDDLIYPSALTKTVRSLASSVGFITNVEKSFSEGPFRESCGMDSLDGFNIRPVYLKKDFSSAYDLTIMANQVRELYLRMLDQGIPCPNVQKIHLKLVQSVYRLGKNNVLWVPENLEGLHGRPYENLRLSVSKWGVVTCKSWKKYPVQTMNYSTLVYDQDRDFVLRCVSAGYLEGLGAIWVPQQRLKKSVFGPPKPAQQVYPRIIPVPGTPYRERIVDSHVFHQPPLVRSTNPLDIFDVLHQTNCSRRIYTTRYNAYVAFLEGEKFFQLALLVACILHIRETEINKLDLLSSVTFEF